MGMSGMVDDNSTMIFDRNSSGSLEVSNAFFYMVQMMKKGYSSLRGVTFEKSKLDTLQCSKTFTPQVHGVNYLLLLYFKFFVKGPLSIPLRCNDPDGYFLLQSLRICTWHHTLRLIT